MAQKLDLETYTLQSGEKINDITEERFLDFLHSFESSLFAEKEYAESGEYEELEKRYKLLKEKIDSLSENLANEPDPARYLATYETKEIKEAMMSLDDYIRFVAANHWDNEEKKFEVFNTNYHSYDEWRNENINEILDKGIEEIQANRGLSEAAMESEIAAHDNPRPDSIDMAGYDFDEYIHSPEFIAKFGDWEKANRLEKLENQQAVEVDFTVISEGKDISEEIKNLRNNPTKENIKKLRDIGHSIGTQYLNTPFENIDTNESMIFVNNTKFQEASSHHIKESGVIEALYHLPELIKNGILVQETPNEDKKRHPEIERYQYLINGFKVGDEEYTAKTVISIDKQGRKFYDQRLSSIEKGNLIDVLKRESDSKNFSRLTKSGEFETALYNYDTRLFRVCQIPQFNFLERNEITGKWQPTMDAVNKIKAGTLILSKDSEGIELLEDRENNITYGTNLSDFIKAIKEARELSKKSSNVISNTNNSLEQSSLDKASELLKGIKFTPENYKKLLNVINDITEMSGTEQIQVPTEEQVQKVSEEKEPQPQTEIQDLDNLEKKQKVETFDPNAPVVYGKTVLPAFTVMSEGKLHSVENAVVMKFNKANQTYLIDNGSEKLELPTKTFETLLKDKQEQEEKIKVAEGRTIVFQDKERGIDGTVIPEFAMYTQHGLETFKDFVPVKHNPADDSYVISNGDTTMTVTAERFKEITAPERFENKFDENSPAWKKLCEQEYKDFFETRDNTAYNFRHNLSVYCRKEANSPCDALHLAKDIISRMPKTEQKQTEKILKAMAHENESTNEVITRLYHEAIKEQPLNEDYIKKYQPDNVIARPMYDTISINGSKIENDPALIRGSHDRNLTIGTTLKNINIETGSVFGNSKSSIRFDELKVISASREGNSITVMDSNKSFIKLPRDTVLNMYKEQQLKEMKQEQRHYRTNSMSISYV